MTAYSTPTASVLTESGKKWVQEFTSHIHENTKTYNVRLWKIKERYPDLDWIDSGTSVVLTLPKIDKTGNRLVNDSDSEYVLKMREGRRASNPPNNKMEDKNPFYLNEVFGEVRIWLEANSRGYSELFAPITDWDEQNFQWLVARKAEMADDVISAHSTHGQRLKEKDNWIIDDAEVGVLDDEYVFIDYGELWLRDDWNVSESSLLK